MVSGSSLQALQDAISKVQAGGSKDGYEALDRTLNSFLQTSLGEHAATNSNLKALAEKVRNLESQLKNSASR